MSREDYDTVWKSKAHFLEARNGRFSQPWYNNLAGHYDFPTVSDAIQPR